MKRHTNPTKEALKETALKITHDHIGGLEKHRLLTSWAQQQNNIKTPLSEGKKQFKATLTAMKVFTP